MYMISLKKICMLKFPTYSTTLFSKLCFSVTHITISFKNYKHGNKSKYKMHAAMELLKLFGKTIILLDDRL